MSGKTFAAVMAVLGVIALLGFGVLNKAEKALNVGDSVPAPALELLEEGVTPGEGETASLSDYRGQWVLLNTWASWCLPCEDEAPDLVAFQEEHAAEGDGGFTILGVQTQDNSEEGLTFVDEYELNYPSIRDGSGDYADDLGATGVPDTILVDPDGNAAYIRRGQIDADILEAEVLPLIEGGSS